MAAVTIMGAFTVVDAATAARVLNGFCSQNGYQPFLADGVTPNPETKAQFMRRYVIQYIANQLIAYESVMAAEAARQTAITNAQGVSVT